jgi:hypothetical protein
MVAEPLRLATGVAVTVQLGAVPAITILATGNKVVFELAALRLAAQVKELSTSAILTARAPVFASSFMV